MKEEKRIKGISKHIPSVRNKISTAGITLVALVVTIIVLIILATISITFVFGENGILEKARQAKEHMANAEAEQQQMLADTANSIDGYIKGEREQVTIDKAEYESMKENITYLMEKIQEKSSSPTGTVISYMGNSAPSGYLSCDGTTYNISEYKDLAEQIKNEFGRYNYYGGDGETTFAVPDLRGEFLRGTGTNSHTNQGSGSAVGIHQNSTSIPRIYLYANSGTISFRYDDGALGTSDGSYNMRNTDGEAYNVGAIKGISVNGNTADSALNAASLNVRPTNTSVLYCIKY